MRKQARSQTKSSCIRRDNEQRNEGLPKEVTVIKTAEGLDFITQRGHTQAAVFSHRRDVVSSVIRTKESFIYCNCTGDFIWRNRVPDLQDSLRKIGNTLIITCVIFNVSSAGQPAHGRTRSSAARRSNGRSSSQHVSALIGCATIWVEPNDRHKFFAGAPPMVVVNNPFAKNPLPEGWRPGAIEYRA